MKQTEAEQLAEILYTSGYDATAERIPTGDWWVRPTRALGGWTARKNMPYDWRQAVERAEARMKQTDTPSGAGMTKETAERYAAVLRERGVHEAGAIPDISEGNDGSWGVSDGNRHFWEYGQFPEVWKQAICAPDRAPALPEVAVSNLDNQLADKLAQIKNEHTYQCRYAVETLSSGRPVLDSDQLARLLDSQADWTVWSRVETLTRSGYSASETIANMLVHTAGAIRSYEMRTPTADPVKEATAPAFVAAYRRAVEFLDGLSA